MSLSKAWVDNLQQSADYVDDNGFVHRPTGPVYVMKDDTVIASNVPGIPNPPSLKRSSKPNFMATKDELERLYQTILNDNNKQYEKDFNQYLSLVRSASPWDAEEAHKLIALRHCWDVRLWRPSRSNEKIIKKNPNNPYTK